MERRFQYMVLVICVLLFEKRSENSADSPQHILCKTCLHETCVCASCN